MAFIPNIDSGGVCMYHPQSRIIRIQPPLQILPLLAVPTSQSLIARCSRRHARFSSVGVGPGARLGRRSILKLSNGVGIALVNQNNSPPNNGTLQPKSGFYSGTSGARVETTIACRARSPSSLHHCVTLPEFLALWTRQPPGLGFYFATQGLQLKVPLIRWKEAFEQDGRHYDAVFENGEVKFMLSRPIVSIDKDNGVLNAQFGSQRQWKPVLSSLRKKYGISPTPDLEITPAIMPKAEIHVGLELPRLAIKMCSALGSLLPGFTSDQLYSSARAARRSVGNVTYDFRTHFPLNESRPALSHLIYVERRETGLQGIVQFFSAHQYFCRIGPPMDSGPFGALLGVLDPVAGAESCALASFPRGRGIPATRLDRAGIVPMTYMVMDVSGQARAPRRRPMGSIREFQIS
jgi:hypothetical protein